MIPAESVPDRRSLTCVMSSVSRSGEWVLPRHFSVISLMGEAVVDLTQVRLAPGDSEIEVRAIMAEVKIIVPHNLRVECDGHPVLGEFKMKRAVKTIPSPEAPLLRITGLAVMASVTIKVVDPTAPSWLDRIRARALREED